MSFICLYRNFFYFHQSTIFSKMLCLKNLLIESDDIDPLPVHFRSTSRPLLDHWTDTGRTRTDFPKICGRTDGHTDIRTEKNVTPKDPLRINARDLIILKPNVSSQYKTKLSATDTYITKLSK